MNYIVIRRQWIITMKVALAQFNIIWEDKESNIANAESLIVSAVKDGADIIFFPEMSFT